MSLPRMRLTLLQDELLQAAKMIGERTMVKLLDGDKVTRSWLLRKLPILRAMSK